MNRTRMGAGAAGVAVFLLLGAAAIRAADAPLYRPVIIGYSNVTGNPRHTDGNLSGGGSNNHPVQMKPDGSGQQFVHCVNFYADLTRGGGAAAPYSPRWVLEILPTAGGSTLEVQSDDGTQGNPSYQQVILDDATFSIGKVRWSPNETRIAFYAHRSVDGGTEVGIYVADIGLDALSRPSILTGIRLAYPVSANSDGFSWSSDNHRITWADGGALWLGDVDAGTAPQRLTPIGVNVRRPVFSPVTGDNRIAFARYVVGSRTSRWDLFTYDTATGQTVQITDASRCKPDAINSPDWSPDARSIVFSAGGLGSTCLWTTRGDGSTKANQITRTYSIAGVPWNTIGGPCWRN